MKLYHDCDVDEVLAEIRASVITLDNCGGLQMAKHPLCNSLWGHQEQEAPPKMREYFGPDAFRKQMAYKLESLREYAREGKWESYVWFYERPWRVHVLAQLVRDKVLDPMTNPGLLMQLWLDTEYPHQALTDWQELFDMIDVETLNTTLDDDEQRARDALKPIVTLYRGITGQYLKMASMGFSWTLNRDKAVWFARRCHAEYPVLLTASCPLRFLVGPLQGRGESEMLVLQPWALFTAGHLNVETTTDEEIRNEKSD